MNLLPQYEAAMAGLRARAREQQLRPAMLEPVFERFLHLADRYARLEQMVLGAVPLQFPVHLLLDASRPVNPIESGADLARRERERLNLGPGGGADLPALVEQQGIKVIQIGAPAESGIAGAFVFHEFFGPAILANAALPSRERDYSLVHQYGHFLADNDPYRVWVCRRGLEKMEDLSEIRAHAFAGAFLVPEADLDSYLLASGNKRGEPLDAELLQQLRTYFEADDRAIVGRLLTSGWLSRSEVAALIHDAGEPAAGEQAPGSENLSPRFVSLAVMARRQGKLTLEEMAHYLDVDETTARRIDSSFSTDEEQKSDGDSSD